MEIRAQATVAAPTRTHPDLEEAMGEDLAVSTPRTVRAPRLNNATPIRRPKASARPAVVSREQELRFIRMDLRRLVITAGVLLLLMILLLLFLD
ncbi:MAG: hypothetical protein H0T49_09035 [Chloroflexia bacterium]|nr:hypothetical protein [Chloroflexia bacterium]